VLQFHGFNGQSARASQSGVANQIVAFLGGLKSLGVGFGVFSLSQRHANPDI
jgi:hypothetical protein